MNETENLKKAILSIQTLKKQMLEQRQRLFEPIAIIGMSCRLPEAKNLSQFWQLLLQGKNVITPLPEQRWQLLQGTEEIAMKDDSLKYWGGYLDQIDAFDAYFFGISPREAMRMDPQQRLMLEVAYEALEDAGLRLKAIQGSKMGVFSSLYASQYGPLQAQDCEMDALLLSTGSAVSIAANRISYLFDLQGPSLSIDTACSSSLIALQLACLSIQTRQCETALVNAVNINLLPSLHALLAKATMLSPSGQCHTFDARADGYVQGEGAGSVVLKPLSQALKDQDRIYAVIAGSAMNQDGRTNGLTAPNGMQQEKLLAQAYRAAGLSPAEVSYLECHGTGTFLGDPIEVQALGEVVGKDRNPQEPCFIGSVKTNVGHLEPAAGIISLIKTALILKHRQIPPHLNFSEANPHIPFADYALAIPQKIQPLPLYGEHYIAGLSGFGFGGANGHVVLRTLTEIETEAAPAKPLARPEELFTLSAKSLTALDQLKTEWLDYLRANPEISLAQVCHNLHLRRNHFNQRLAIVCTSYSDLLEKLSNLQLNQPDPKAGFFVSTLDNQQPSVMPAEPIDSHSLAEHYVNQAEIDWLAYESNRAYPALEMPLYPWQHKSYWPTFRREAGLATATKSPLAGRALLSPLPQRQFEFSFDTQTLPEIHDTFGVLHAGYYTEMLAHALQQSAFSLHNLSFTSPIFVADGRKVLVQLILEAQSNDETEFQFYSFDGRENWVKHASGSLSLKTSPAAFPQEAITRLQQSSAQGDAESCYQTITALGMPAGESIRWIDRYWIGQKAILCQLRAETPADRAHQFIHGFHPGLIDACIQSLFLLLPEEIKAAYMASSLGPLEFYKDKAKPGYVYAQLEEIEAGGKILQGHWVLLDEQLDVMAECRRIRLSQLGDSLRIRLPESSCQMDWSQPYQACKTELINWLLKQTALIFSMPKEDLSAGQALNLLGMDSLMALSLLQAIEKNLSLSLPLSFIMQGPSVSDLAERILAEKFNQPANQPAVIKPLQTNLWIANRKVKEEANVRLFCLPYGGGGASVYRDWQKHFPEQIEICPIQLPGRENRIDEAALHSLPELVDILAQQLEPLLDLPFAFFGHSFGALIAFELSRHLRRERRATPIHLFASAYPAPQRPSTSLNKLLAHLQEENIDLFSLSSEKLIQLEETQLATLSRIFHDHGLIDYADERMSKEIIQVLLPIFIADMNIVKTYHYQREKPLDLDLTLFYGEKDSWVPIAELGGWEGETSGRFQSQGFEGGHLFVREPATLPQLIHRIRQGLQHFCQTSLEENTH